jgi:hypothetical protein
MCVNHKYLYTRRAIPINIQEVEDIYIDTKGIAGLLRTEACGLNFFLFTFWSGSMMGSFDRVRYFPVAGCLAATLRT